MDNAPNSSTNTHQTSKKRVVSVPGHGYSLTEFTILSLPDLGQSFVTGDSLISLESDKSVHDVHAQFDCVVIDVHAKIGQVLSVGSPIVSIELLAIPESSSVLEANSELLPPSTDTSSATSEKSWSVVQADMTMIDQMWNIWFGNQGIASRSSSLQATPKLREEFSQMIHKGLHAPFAAYCAILGGKVDGWVACFPMKNNPISRGKVAEVSLYVQDPNSTATPAILLMNQIINHARATEIAFLVGMSNPNNVPVQKLLKATGFDLLGNAGKQKTQIWVFNL